MSSKIKELKGDEIIIHYPEKKICIVSQKDIHRDSVPIFCNLCGKAMSTRMDEAYYKEFECCHLCAMKWAESDSNRWSSGWRPTKDEVKEEIKNRK